MTSYTPTGMKRCGRHIALAALLLLAVVPHIDASCYLLDANAPCAVCWQTSYASSDDKTGVTKMAECPIGVEETWIVPLPEAMHAMEEYTVEYALKLDAAKFGHIAVGDHDIPHANVHSCIASRGACTPFVRCDAA